MFAPLSIELVQFFIDDPLFLEIFVRLIKHQSRSRVLDRVVRVGLDVLVKHKPRKETKRKTTLTLSQEVKIYRVVHLLWRDVDVNDPKVL